jgi:hypothetical protein
VVRGNKATLVNAAIREREEKMVVLVHKVRPVFREYKVYLEM